MKRLKNFKFPYKIIKRDEYDLLLEVKEDYLRLTEEMDIEPMSASELFIHSLISPMFSFGTRLLLRNLKKE